MQPTQKILLVVVISLATLLIVLGIQVIFILKDAKKAVKRLNTLLDDSILGGGLLKPEKLTSIFQVFKKEKDNKQNGSIN